MVTTIPIDRATIRYEYDSVPVVCVHCGETFKSHELECGGEPGDDFSVCICPRCHVGDCCDVEYEELADAVKEMS